MRDDFNKGIKDTLSQRVGMLCSNPECKRMTFGPNSNKNKSTNIGVAAHITAASPRGPRYDRNMKSNERCSINNAIWLCQSCAKLIDSDESKYPVGLLENWKRLAESYAESQLNERQMPQDKCEKVIEQMPDLINEMADDLEKDTLAREFVLIGKNGAYNNRRGVLVYYYEDHENLDKKVRVLENYTLINDITFNNTKRYVFTEKFVDILSKLK